MIILQLYIQNVCIHPPGALSVSVLGLSFTSILLQFSVIEGVEPSEYTIIYSNTNTQCFSDSGTLSITDASAEGYNIEGLEEGTEYTITVILERTDGLSDRDTVRPTTEDDCKPYTHGMVVYITSTCICLV